MDVDDPEVDTDTNIWNLELSRNEGDAIQKGHYVRKISIMDTDNQQVAPLQWVWIKENGMSTLSFNFLDLQAFALEISWKWALVI